MDASSSSAPGTWETRAVRWFVRLALVVSLLAVIAQLAEIPWRSALRGYDNTFNYLWLRSLMVDGDWDFANDIQECNTLSDESRELARVLQPTALGRLPNKYGIGWAVLSAPAYLAADLLVALGNAVGVWQLPRDGFGPVYQVMLQLWHVFLAGASLLLARRVLVTWFSAAAATLGVVIVWIGSPLLYYQTSNIGMSHGAVFFAVVVMVYGLVRGMATPTGRWPWLLAGAGFGLAVVTRYQAGVFGLVALMVVVERLRRDGACGLNAVGWMFLGAVPFVALQSFAWHVVYGRWLVFSYGGENESFAWLQPQIGSALFSSWHGLFYWHPLILVGLGGLVWWACSRGRVGSPSTAAPPDRSPLPTVPSARVVALGLLAAAGATIYVNAAWWCWWFASAFGSRAFDGALLGIMGGMAFLWTRANRVGQRFLLFAGGTLVAWNLYVFALFRSAAISRNEPVTWFDMIMAAPSLLRQLSFD